MPASDPLPEPRHADRSGFLTFWTTLPGILTGSAALLTAIIGLITLLNGTRADPASSPNDSGAGAVEASPSPAASPSSDSAVAPPGGPPAGVFARRELTMKSPDSADLESGLVGSSPPGYDLYLYCSGTECILNAMRSLLTVADGAETRDDCVAALRTRREQALTLGQLQVGQTLCIQTEEGHVGTIRIRELPGVGSIDFTIAYTLWR
jgi:hypothetical protein